MQKENDNDTSAVMDAVRLLARGMMERDTVAISQLLDEHYTLTHITGYVQPKAEWLIEIARESMKYYSVKEVNHTVKVIGGKANVMVRSRVDARIWGSRHTWSLQQKMNLEKRNGRWIILDAVASIF